MGQYKRTRIMEYKDILDICPINNDSSLLVYKLERQTIINKHEFAPIITQGIITSDTLTKYNNQEVLDLKNEPNYYIINNSLLERMQLWGYPVTTAEKTDVSFDEFHNGLSYKQLDDFLLHSDLCTPIHTLHMDNMIEDMNGNLLPLGQKFNHLNGRYHNGCYDLQKAVNILSKNPTIVFYEDRFGDVVGPFKAIQPLDYNSYHRSPYCTESLFFVWQPTAEEYRKVYAKKSWNQRDQAVFDLDIFGLRAGGAAYFNDYWDGKDDL